MTLSEAQVREEPERNDEWIVKLFWVTSRAYCRPPFGKHNSTVDAVEGSLGYTRSVERSGSYNDSGGRPPTAQGLREKND